MTVTLEQALALQRELAETRLALRSAVDEQDRLTVRNAELAEQLAVVEAERDQAVRALERRL
jgi:regulator of replication initiation timing